MTIDNIRIDDGSWISMISDATQYFKAWQDHADKIDRLYAGLEHWADNVRDRQMGLFWSNIQVMLPAIYARPPVPVVVPKFRGRDRVYNVASEFLERCTITSFDLAHIDQVMLAIRDDLAIVGRGAGWLRYEDSEKGECIKYEHVDRSDFLHDPARKWCDVEWVARRGWMTRDQMKERFGEEKAALAEYYVRSVDDRMKDNGFSLEDYQEKCGVWEMWHKGRNKVVWLTESAVLEEDEPHLKLEGFFPCPEPAYATVQRRTLIPVPDVVYYRDQLDEINTLTSRIHTLGEALVLKGFYPGGGEIGGAIEAAFDQVEAKVMIPIANWAAFGGNDPKIIWLPIDMIAKTITDCVALRQQLIEDVYQITGLSDIMRGQTQADETATAQALKQQNGSSRVRDKQMQLVRVAKQFTCLGAEIMSEKFDDDTLELWSQMDLPTEKERAKEEQDFRDQVKAHIDQMQAQAAQMPPDQADENAFQQQVDQVIQEAAPKLREIVERVTLDSVMDVLRDEKLRPFALDIETDSTIYPNEAAEKASRAEFLRAFSETIGTVQGLASMGAEGINLAGAMMKFALAPYRVGRELDGHIDAFVEAAPAIAERMQADSAPDDMAALAEAEMEKARVAGQKVQVDAQKAQVDAQMQQMKLQQDMAKAQVDLQEKAAKLQLEQERVSQEWTRMQEEHAKLVAEVDNIRADTMKKISEAGVIVDRQALDEFKSLKDIELRQNEQAVNAQQREVDTALRVQDGERAAQMGERQQSLAEQQAQRGNE